MKKWMLMLAAVMVTMMGCGQNECEECADIYVDAAKEACKGKKCGYCDCAQKKGKYYDGTSCKDAPKDSANNTDEKCEGKVLEAAKECVKNKSTRKSEMKSAIEQYCK